MMKRASTPEMLTNIFFHLVKVTEFFSRFSICPLKIFRARNSVCHFNTIFHYSRVAPKDSFGAAQPQERVANHQQLCGTAFANFAAQKETLWATCGGSSLNRC
ncbi:hypothetical protein Mal52_21880 [Symmachiella dynata]|uniref:Uncharacterized protein n=1 Tax=Symmachiella dynata TaxID=2527995 RepID=A0A517ZMK0_9PLAN|nr:hypothetical protein Mal52_21880 [Symmachiella dynata]